MSDDEKRLEDIIAIHFWGKRAENNADKMAEALAPVLRKYFDITPKPTPQLTDLLPVSWRPKMPAMTKIEIDRTVPIADAGGAMIGYSSDHPGKQFLIIPQEK